MLFNFGHRILLVIFNVTERIIYVHIYMDFRSKYLKYKGKYTGLKSTHLGGNGDIITDYTINLLWINSTSKNKIEELVRNGIVDSCNVLVKNGNIKIYLFVDSVGLLDEDYDYLRNNIDRTVQIINLRSIFLPEWSLGVIKPETQEQMFGFKLEDLFTYRTGVYVRVDFAKILIHMYHMEMFYRDVNNVNKFCYNIFLDLNLCDGPDKKGSYDAPRDIPKLSPEHFTSQNIADKLKLYGVILYGGNSYSVGTPENRFIYTKSTLNIRVSFILVTKILSREIGRLANLSDEIRDDMRVRELERNIGYIYFNSIITLIDNFLDRHIITYDGKYLPREPIEFTRAIYEKIDSSGVIITVDDNYLLYKYYERNTIRCKIEENPRYSIIYSIFSEDNGRCTRMPSIPAVTIERNNMESLHEWNLQPVT
jgi:hypothetical protein